MPGDTLAVAYLHPGEVSHSFFLSMRDLWAHDLTHEQRLVALIAEECGASRIIDGRNAAVRKFLDTDAEWLGFVDADMGFDGDMFDRLIRAAHPTDRPMVGALAFAQKRAAAGELHSQRFTSHPTIYRWVEEGSQHGCAPQLDYPKNSLVKCDATGGSCFVAHRSVFEKLAEEFPEPRQWFDETIYRGRVYGEDLTFFLRAKEHGFPLHVHTGIQTSHYKHTYLTERSVGDLTDVPTYVVIPFKNRHDLTGPLVEQLAVQGGYRRVMLFDNGSDDPDTIAWMDSLDLPGVELVDAEGLGLHDMWNVGLEAAQQDAGGAHNVAILNNDIEIGDGFLVRLAKALRDDPIMGVVGPNYDGRDLDGVELTTDICAGRYDGTGGLPGFAFMLRGESGYRFPPQLNWWYGDSDLVMTAVSSGAHVGIVGGATCVHVDGGGQTGDWDDPDMKRLLDEDREWFRAKWAGDEAA